MSALVARPNQTIRKLIKLAHLQTNFTVVPVLLKAKRRDHELTTLKFT